MVPLTDLILPILLSAVLVFVVSSILHMVVQLHKRDYAKLPNEDAVLAGLRAQGVGPGDYMFPLCGSMKDLATDEMKAKLAAGPIGTMTVRPSGQISMGPALVQWFLYSILMSVFAGYLAGLAVPPGGDYLRVFQVAGATAFLGYGLAYVPDSIWKGLRWSTTLKFAFDGFLYACVTAGTFGWLWPAA